LQGRGIYTQNTSTLSRIYTGAAYCFNFSKQASDSSQLYNTYLGSLG
jgi:hypothetical protein